MKNNKSVFLKLQPALLATFVFIVLVLATYAFTRFKKGQWEKDVRTEMLDYLTGKKSNLEKALYSRIFYTRGVAAYVALKPEITDEEFAKLAQEYIQNDSVISTMALSKNCVINAIFPREGHEAAIGLNLLDHPKRKEIVEKTIQTQLTFIAGPVELVEGGVAFISYTPIFDKTVQGANKFWGVTDIVISKDGLLEEAEIKESESKYKFALRGYDGLGNEGVAFWGEDEVFNSNPVSVSIELPIGNWVLAAVPLKGWKQYLNQDKTLMNMLLMSALLISVLIWLIARTWLRVKTSEKELKAVFDSLDSIIIEFNGAGDYVKINSMNEELLVQPKEELVGKNLDDIFDREKAEFFRKAINECISEKKLVVIEYSVMIGDEEHWFSARLSYKDSNAAIYNAYDITESKKQEQLLIESEKRLMEINEAKNKFFSIIAHDLRGPLGSHKTVIEMVLDADESMDAVTQKELLGSLQASSENIYELLENLLKWSMSQSGKTEINTVEVDLFEQARNLVRNYANSAQLKRIELINDIDVNSKIITDINLLDTICRNLISNAIKFTSPGGVVRLSAENVTKSGKKYFKLQVADTGLGMSPEKLQTLFFLDKAESNAGTANEKGNGIGLILCQEFAEKLGTRIEVSSTPKKGSTFSILLPKVE
ncbi:ATP-binding protein [uncultured Draconibacterium sp.]|uniref:sensor histidine kinase n=1 Tax=uncultured Draconibacterium sp. TaxID=1573823 RepID=UPI003217DBFE